MENNDLSAPAQDEITSDTRASLAWDNVSWRFGEGASIGAALFYPVAILQGGAWIVTVYGALALCIVVTTVGARLRYTPPEWLSYVRAADALALAPLTLLIPWWDVLTTRAVFAAAFPILLGLYIFKGFIRERRRMNPARRRRLVNAAAVVWALAAVAAFAKFATYPIQDDPNPLVLAASLLVGAICLWQSISFARTNPTPEAPSAG